MAGMGGSVIALMKGGQLRKGLKRQRGRLCRHRGGGEANIPGAGHRSTNVPRQGVAWFEAPYF